MFLTSPETCPVSPTNTRQVMKSILCEIMSPPHKDELGRIRNYRENTSFYLLSDTVAAWNKVTITKIWYESATLNEHYIIKMQTETEWGLERLICRINKTWEVIALEELTSSNE